MTNEIGFPLKYSFKIHSNAPRLQGTSLPAVTSKSGLARVAKKCLLTVAMSKFPRTSSY